MLLFPGVGTLSAIVEKPADAFADVSVGFLSPKKQLCEYDASTRMDFSMVMTVQP